MQHSLALLQDESNDYMSRCVLLEDFKNKFETLMSAELIAAFNAKSIGRLRTFLSLNMLDSLEFNVSRCNQKLYSHIWKNEPAQRVKKVLPPVREGQNTGPTRPTGADSFCERWPTLADFAEKLVRLSDRGLAQRSRF
jgi:hypothetical protein